MLLAVRASNKGTMFVRTLFTMTERKINIYLNKRLCQKISLKILKSKEMYVIIIIAYNSNRKV